MLRIKIRNNFRQTTGNTTTSKYVTLPLGLSFTPTDYEEQREEILKEERIKAINNPDDGERIRYTKPDGLTINVRFYNGTTFVNDYSAVGFTSGDYRKKGFTKSFYRFYFYDGVNDNNNNLLFTEDIMTLDDYDGGITEIPTLTLDRLFWLRNDSYFVTNSGDRDVYMNGRFFNAKDGKVHKLISTPISISTPPYHNNVVSNPEWLKSVLTLMNPNTNNGYYNFTTQTPTITLTEDIRI
jgi:hypothetical protein